MSVIGVDFGNTNIAIAAAQKGGVDVLANEASNRQTPNMVGFGEKERFMGEAAMTQYTRNIQNTVTNVKLLLGRKFDEPEIQEIIKTSPVKLVELPNKEIGIQVMYAGERKTFTPQQITAMMLQKVVEISEKGTTKKLNDLVISIPGFWTEKQRRALLDSCSIANINCLGLINDIAATALQYGIFKTNLPEKDPIRVMFIDMGSNHTQVSIVDFVKGSLKVVASAFERDLGGNSFDKVLVDHFAKQFKDKYKIDIYTNRRALIRTYTACEKLKKMLNTNPEAPINIDSLMNDIDVRGTMKRGEFEEIIRPMLEKAMEPVKQALADAGTTADKLFSVEITGGALRLQALQNKLADYLKRDISKTVNPEESVARGTALRCAALSPLFKVREFNVTDITPYPIRVSWKYTGTDAMQVDTDTTEVFTKSNPVPSIKMITFLRDKGFEINAEYSSPESLPQGTDPFIAKFVIPAIPQPSPEKAEEAPKIRVKIKLTDSTILQIAEAQYVESVESNEPEPTDKKPEAKKEDAPKEAEQTPQTPPATSDQTKTGELPKKYKVKKTDLTVEAHTTGLSQSDIRALVEDEGKMAAADKLAVETAERKNAVESYVYNMRAKLNDNLNHFVTESDKSNFLKLLDETESWLYGDGAEATKSTYQKKLDELKTLGDPIVRRQIEAENRLDTVQSLRSAIENSKLQATTIDPKYDHIEQVEKNKIVAEADAAQKWLNEHLSKQEALPKSTDPILTCADITKKRQDLEKFANNILSKPKPKPKEEPKKDEPKKEEPKKEEPKKEEPKKEEPKDSKPNAQEMDLD